MRPNIRSFLEVAVKQYQVESPVVDLGSYVVKGQEKLADLRPLFPDNEFVGVDMRQGPGVDRVDNAEYLRFKDNEVGCLICIDTLQCVRNLFKAREEMNRVLNKDGLLFIASAMNAPYNIRYFYNYWRFTPKGFDYLMDSFNYRTMFMQGDVDNPHTIIGIASKNPNKVAPFNDSAFIEKVRKLEEEPFYPYNVNHLHQELLEKDKNNAMNV